MKSDAPPARPKLTPEQTLILGIQTSRARGKQHYQAAAAKEKELMARCKPGTPIELPDGRKYAIVDTFADQDTLKKMVFLDRYELREIKA